MAIYMPSLKSLSQKIWWDECMLTMTINVETNSHKILFLSYFSLLFLYLLLFIIIVSSFILRKKCPYFMLALYLLPLDLFQQMPSNPQKQLKSSHLKIKINLNDLSSYYLFILSCSTFFYYFCSYISRRKEKIIFYIFLCGVTFAMETSLTNWFMDG
jgi:hypothetical protein